MTPPDVSAQVIEWVVRLLTSLVAGVLGALVAYRWRRGEERRESHLAELRTDVFGPMLAYLDKYVLPIARHEASNVDVCIEQIPASGGPMARPDFQEILCVRMATDPLQQHIFGMGVVPPLPSPPVGPLMDDARRHHYADLLRRWDAVASRFREYNDACLRYVGALRAHIINENRLVPEFTSNRPRWIPSGSTRRPWRWLCFSDRSGYRPTT